MRLIPEYEPVRKLYLSFVQEFFNERFGYGKALCEIINAAQRFVDVELFISLPDLPYFEEECARCQVSLGRVTLTQDTPARAIVAEYVPIFAEDESGEGVALVFQHPRLDHAMDLKHFSERLTARLGYRALDLGFGFATAMLSVNEELVLLSASLFEGTDREMKLQFFRDNFPGQSFHIVPPLAGDVTHDLDMVLWPIAPKVWVVSEYPARSPQANSIEPALQILRDHHHTVHRVPGLEPIIYEDINTMPNYANGVIINGAALVPQYGCQEDEIVAGILRDHGYEVIPIDSSRIILSNSAVHCISKTVPAAPRSISIRSN
jgi:agmatine/peptidylarginine deiminase